jgi:hypothetical protein
MMHNNKVVEKNANNLVMVFGSKIVDIFVWNIKVDVEMHLHDISNMVRRG